jgi:protein tyrosine phosphatase
MAPSPFSTPTSRRASPQSCGCLAKILLEAKRDRSNVIVHCHAGVCRSGAVAQAGIDIGFQDTEVFRSPNLRVKKMVSNEVLNLIDNNPEYG